MTDTLFEYDHLLMRSEYRTTAMWATGKLSLMKFAVGSSRLMRR